MSVINNDIYNEEVKDKFIKTYENEQSQITLLNYFKKSESTERQLEKDLYDFDINEISKVMHNVNPLSLSVSRSAARSIAKYISWAIDNGYRSNNINPMDYLETNWYEEFIDRNVKMYFSEDELDDLINLLVNAQDRALVKLIFEGVKGYSSSELYNLNVNDIDWENNILNVKDDKKGQREVIVSDECMKILKAAHEQEDFIFKNGESDSRSNSRKLIKSDFIFKNIDSGKTINTNGVDKHYIYRAIQKIRDYFNVSYLTPNAIYKSGMIKIAKDLYLRDGKLENEQLNEIAERFNVTRVTNNGYSYYNLGILKEYINRENILELYGVDIEG
jgi:integrase